MSEEHTPQELASAGKSAYQQAQYRKAADLFAAAENGFQAEGGSLDAAEMANNRSVALLQMHDAEGAYQAVKGTAALFAAAGDVRRQAMALGNEGSALKELGRTLEAARAYEEAAELFKSVGEREMRSMVLRSLSMLQLQTGRPYEGLASMNIGLEEKENANPAQRLLRKLLAWPVRWLTGSARGSKPDE